MEERNFKSDSLPDYLQVQEVMMLTGVKQAKAYKIIKQMNAELQEKGFITFSGRVPKNYFLKRTGLIGNI